MWRVIPFFNQIILWRIYFDESTKSVESFFFFFLCFIYTRLLKLKCTK